LRHQKSERETLIIVAKKAAVAYINRDDLSSSLNNKDRPSKRKDPAKAILAQCDQDDISRQWKITAAQKLIQTKLLPTMKNTFTGLSSCADTAIKVASSLPSTARAE